MAEGSYEAFASLTNITWVSFFVEQASHSPAATQALVQAQLASAVVWLGYAEDHATKGAARAPELAKRYERIAAAAHQLALQVAGVSAGTPAETDPAFENYKEAIVASLQGPVGGLYHRVQRLAEKIDAMCA